MASQAQAIPRIRPVLNREQVNGGRGWNIKERMIKTEKTSVSEDTIPTLLPYSWPLLPLWAGGLGETEAGIFPPSHEHTTPKWPSPCQSVSGPQNWVAERLPPCYNQKWDPAVHCSKADKEARLVERQICFILDVAPGEKGRLLFKG